MKDARITQDDLAEALEMTQGGVQHWLAGTRQPALEDIDRIAAVLGVPGAYLTHGVTAEDLVSDLPEPARGVLRQLIARQRQGNAPVTLWTAIEQMLMLMGSGAPTETTSFAGGPPSKAPALRQE